MREICCSVRIRFGGREWGFSTTRSRSLQIWNALSDGCELGMLLGDALGSLFGADYGPLLGVDDDNMVVIITVYLR